MIKLSNISKTFRIKAESVMALQAINLEVAAGNICGVIGKSGAGKSTLIRCVNLLERPDCGQVIVDHQPLLGLSPLALRRARHKIGMVFQHFNLLSSRNVYDNVAFPLELLNLDRGAIRKAVLPLLELVGLQDRIHAYPQQLSGGQKQRVAIARALATQPKLLLCDEMTSALDPETTRAILDLVSDISQKMQLTVLLITHEMQVIKRICDTVAVIDQGCIVEQGDVVNVFCKPQHEITRNLTQAAFHLQLPPALHSKIQQQWVENSYTLLCISFVGELTGKPLINQLICDFQLEITILQSDIEMLKAQPLGMLLVAVQAQQSQITAALKHLALLGLAVEVLGYVTRDNWHFS